MTVVAGTIIQPSAKQFREQLLIIKRCPVPSRFLSSCFFKWPKKVLEHQQRCFPGVFSLLLWRLGNGLIPLLANVCLVQEDRVPCHHCEPLISRKWHQSVIAVWPQQTWPPIWALIHIKDSELSSLLQLSACFNCPGSILNASWPNTQINWSHPPPFTNPLKLEVVQNCSWTHTMRDLLWEEETVAHVADAHRKLYQSSVTLGHRNDHIQFAMHLWPPALECWVRHNNLGAGNIIQLFWEIPTIFLLFSDGCWHLKQFWFASAQVLNSKKTSKRYFVLLTNNKTWPFLQTGSFNLVTLDWLQQWL